MKEISKASKLLSGVLVIGMLISVGAPLLASNTTSTAAPTTAVEQAKGGPGGPGGRGGPGGMRLVSDEDLSGLVNGGIIDQTIADKLKTFIDEKKASIKAQQPAEDQTGSKPNMWAGAVTDGIITQDTADTINNAMQKNRENGTSSVKHKPGDELTSLVSSGVIDQNTADALKTYMDKQRSERKDQSPPSGVAKPEKRADMWSEAVTSGIITEDQAVLIRSSLQEAREKARQEQVANAISTLVSDQIITQERADKVTAFLQAQDESRAAEQAKMEAMTQEEREAQESARKAEMEKIKAMTDDERKAFMQAKQADRKSPLSQLVTDGTLTEDQASALEKALFSHRGAGPEKG